MAHRFDIATHAASLRSGKVDAGLLLWIIGLAVLSLAFGLLTFSRQGQLEVYTKGSDAEPFYAPKDSLEAVLEHNANRRREITSLEKSIAQQEAHIRELDFQLTGYGAYWSDQVQHNGWLLGGENQESAWKTTEQVLAQRAARLQYWSEVHRNPAAQSFDELDELINKFQVDQQEVLTRAADTQARFEIDRENLLLELDRLAVESREVDMAFNLSKGTLETEKLKLDAQIRELLDLRLEWFTETEKFAEAQEVDLQNRYVILNKGLGDGVLPGLRFEMYTFDAGKYVVKGLVEVVDLQEHIAKCRILEEVDPRRMPLHPGDMAGNPVFSPSDPKVFVFAGEFKRFNRSDLESFVRALGAEVWPEIGPGVDYLIAGNHSESVQDKAREFRLLAMYEDTLVRFLTTTFSPR